MRRGVLIVVAAVLTVVAILGVLVFFSARDDSTIGGGESAPGEAAPEATGAQLERGNVVLFFSSPADREVLRALAEEFGPESLAEEGQAVLLQRDPGREGIEAVAYKRRLLVAAPDDPELRRFIEYWLGRGRMP